MILYYTGAATFQAQQKFAYKSLGGYISSTPVPNDYLNAIFDSVSEFGKQNKKPTYLIIALYNNSNADRTNVRAWFDQIFSDESDVIDQQFCIFKIAGLPVIADSCGDLVTEEKLPTIGSKPFSVTLVEADTEVNAIFLPDLPAGQYYALVISREIRSEVSECDNLSDEQFQSIYIDHTLSLATKENIELHIAYD